ncbi:hypothetical protein [Natronobeatus ordinarius]|uniref:hypothetical protein n=1 Tax=Natronobeatus ordinarius TaxID=2963433 RepID=UPI0020CFBE7B|nr:hypothetical protein [Natronobeatus ordinarius]
MNVFSVGDREFADRVSFNRYLTENYSVSHNSNLHIIAGITEHPWSKLIDILENSGYEVIEEHGEILKMRRDYGLNGRIEFYLSFDEELQVILFYTNMRKTEEIENTIEVFLNDTPGVHYLYISPRVMQSIREDIAEEEPATQITHFSAKRVSHSGVSARIRPDHSRTIEYHGNDGLETMREMEENYGVLPRLMEFRVPDLSKFKINKEGIFTFQSGDLDYLLEQIETCIKQVLKIKRAYNDADFKMVRTSDQLEVPTAEPASITLKNHLQYHEVDNFKSNMKDNGYVLLDTFAEEGSLYLSSKVIDQEKKNTFRIKANEDEIRVFPQGEKDIGSFFRFYEFVQDTLDEDASLEVHA